MLTFNLKKEWFDKIKSGEKTHEYREEKYYWTSRFVEEFYEPKNKEEKKGYIEFFLIMLRRAGFVFKDVTKNHKICFMNGMEKENKRPRMYAKFISVKIVNGNKTDLKIDKPVYDIEFELIQESEK
jgi:hypothetical protein